MKTPTHEAIQEVMRLLSWDRCREPDPTPWPLAPRAPKPEKNPCPCGSGQRIGECDAHLPRKDEK